MKLVITGSTGLVGRALVAECLRLGHRVTALVRQTQNPRLASDSRLTTHAWDLSRADNGAFAGAHDALVHLAAFIPPDMNEPAMAEQCFRNNAFAVTTLIDTAARAGIKQILFASSGALYENRGTPANEEDAVYPALSAPYYLASKLAGEVFARDSARRHGIPLAILRIGSVYGPDMRRESVLPRFLLEAMEGRTHAITRPEHTADFVYVDDVAWACLATVEKRAQGVINVGSGIATSMAELSRITQTLAGRVPPGEAVPPADITDRRAGFPALDIGRAASSLGFNPTRLNTGLQRMLSEL